ncbi:uncharacterized protein LOC119124248 isoform X2 [Syngnathus acus]|uniref:uncharacterized protein LOC119124248 isoform X2 n=1 Tax=Syngnathus acus TaxID=161584 RepID=UPI001885FA2F|nr:uncharacterized protein LOC119124248 isoform X2 [Syngnathus acus]
MLQKYHSVHEWEALTPWRRHHEEIWLEELAEEALACDDMIALAELPGAFTIYDSSRKECFTAVSLLYKLNTCRRQEKEELTALVDRLDKESLRLLCLYIRSATLRGQKEKRAYDAYLAVGQSWHAWPRVASPHKEEQAATLLRADDDIQQHSDDQLSKQSLLELLVLTQQQERKQLVRLLQGITLEDVQRAAPTDSLKTSCIKRLQQIFPSSEKQPQWDISRGPKVWSQDQLERATLDLLVELLEIQERQTSSFLLTLLNEREHLQALREDFQSKLQAQHLHANLLQLLNPDASLCSSHANLSSQEHVPQQASSSEPAEVQNVTGGPRESQTAADTIGTKPDGDQIEDVADKQGVCAGCGVTLGGLPYLEVLCVPDSLSKVDGEGGRNDEDGETRKCEEQDSLITLAWSTHLEDLDGKPANAVAMQTQPSAERREGDLKEAGKENDFHANLQQASASSTDEVKELGAPEVTAHASGHCSTKEKMAAMEGVRQREPVSALEREKTMRKLVDVHRRVERRQQRDRDRQQLKVQERLSIIQSRKADEDLFGPKHTERMRHLRKDVAQDENQKKMLVREQLEQLRRERSFIMQSRRKRNTAGFKELLAPAHLQSRGTEERSDQDDGLQ